MKKGQRRHKAGYKHWQGRKPKEFKAESTEMTFEMQERIARRISEATGWSLSWVLSLDDKAIKRLAQKYL